MVLACLRVEFLLPGSNSLKQKRFVLNSLKTRLRNKFNVSVCETGYQDKWQRSELAIVTVANTRRLADRFSQNVISFLEKENRIVLLDFVKEIL